MAKPKTQATVSLTVQAILPGNDLKFALKLGLPGATPFSSEEGEEIKLSYSTDEYHSEGLEERITTLVRQLRALRYISSFSLSAFCRVEPRRRHDSFAFGAGAMTARHLKGSAWEYDGIEYDGFFLRAPVNVRRPAALCSRLNTLLPKLDDFIFDYEVAIETYNFGRQTQTTVDNHHEL